MNVVVDIKIEKPKNLIWSAITDIENCSNMISSIIELNILNQPKTGIVGLKWEETRRMFGKEATEVMWVTESVENEYYCTRAESHGCVYTTKLSVNDCGKCSLLTMSFTGEAQNLITKIISAGMNLFINNSMKKALRKDLEDIKQYVEQT